MRLMNIDLMLSIEHQQTTFWLVSVADEVFSAKLPCNGEFEKRFSISFGILTNWLLSQGNSDVLSS